MTLQRKHVRQEWGASLLFYLSVGLYRPHRSPRAPLSVLGFPPGAWSEQRKCSQSNHSTLLECGWEVPDTALYYCWSKCQNSASEGGQDCPNLNDGMSRWQTLSWSRNSFHNIITLICSFPGYLVCVCGEVQISRCFCPLSDQQSAIRPQGTTCSLRLGAISHLNNDICHHFHTSSCPGSYLQTILNMNAWVS